MQPLEAKFQRAKRSLYYPGVEVCIALDHAGLSPHIGLYAYLGSLLGEVWNLNEPSVRLGKAWTRGGRLKRIGFLIMCERACR